MRNCNYYEQVFYKYNLTNEPQGKENQSPRRTSEYIGYI